MGTKKILLLGAVACLLATLWYFDVWQQLTLENLKANQASLVATYQSAPVLMLALFTAVFIAYSALPLPGLILLTLTGSAIFGFVPAFLIVSFGSAIGATLAFLLSRYLFGSALQRAFPAKHQRLNEGIERDGAWYLFSIRMVPVIPFFLVNLLMGLTPIQTQRFYLATQTGMLVSTAIFVNAGTQLGQIDSIDSLFSPALLASFMLMAAVPLILKKLMSYFPLRADKQAATQSVLAETHE